MQQLAISGTVRSTPARRCIIGPADECPRSPPQHAVFLGAMNRSNLAQITRVTGSGGDNRPTVGWDEFLQSGVHSSGAEFSCSSRCASPDEDRRIMNFELGFPSYLCIPAVFHGGGWWPDSRHKTTSSVHPWQRMPVDPMGRALAPLQGKSGTVEPGGCRAATLSSQCREAGIGSGRLTRGGWR